MEEEECRGPGQGVEWLSSRPPFVALRSASNPVGDRSTGGQQDSKAISMCRKDIEQRARQDICIFVVYSLRDVHSKVHLLTTRFVWLYSMQTAKVLSWRSFREGISPAATRSPCLMLSSCMRLQQPALALPLSVIEQQVHSRDASPFMIALASPPQTGSMSRAGLEPD